MRVGEDHVGHVFRLDALGLQLLRQLAANAKSADIQQRHTPLPTEKRHGAPTETTMTDGTPRKTLNQQIELVHEQMCMGWQQNLLRLDVGIFDQLAVER
ncbi:hypothetical protein GCM10011496_36060 [Polaromonas eurypsychrophila]|uniref:Uncharacterized protein n=1 Tax=Polaromonas eurypsychrophila TaxID=1614635 RepID=A0A916WMF7_9BURK|nr:hypothetical protein GCM10011496_36060 [Polaromonas eurypsychrophila]